MILHFSITKGCCFVDLEKRSLPSICDYSLGITHWVQIFMAVALLPEHSRPFGDVASGQSSPESLCVAQDWCRDLCYWEQRWCRGWNLQNLLLSCGLSNSPHLPASRVSASPVAMAVLFTSAEKESTFQWPDWQCSTFQYPAPSSRSSQWSNMVFGVSSIKSEFQEAECRKGEEAKWHILAVCIPHLIAFAYSLLVIAQLNGHFSTKGS
ncbi:uncharacterized protein LOC122222633 [Panthera leo]|uniref:uncharacterized protein LOC122222633 n=1 Tax=Panthera leo TaxID=9689 RepID=UPI001C6A30FA|nr:uncharacterized protein LOC122222633 [Panthera leo]